MPRTWPGAGPGQIPLFSNFFRPGPGQIPLFSNFFRPAPGAGPEQVFTG